MFILDAMKRVFVIAVLIYGCVVVFCNPSLAQAPLVNIETVFVGDAGNSGIGAVDYDFRMGRYEVIMSQYATFLNTVAAVTSQEYLINLWSPNMNLGTIAGVARSGSGTLVDPFIYTTVGSGQRPIHNVDWSDAARFANWMHNGAGVGSDTENGAYTLNGSTNGIAGFGGKNEGALWWIPNDVEWIKSAYYKGGTNAAYWTYPTQSDTQPTAEANPPGGPNSANYNNVRTASSSPLNEVGAYTESASAYGTFDQGGNVWEWVTGEGFIPGARGGSFDWGVNGLLSSERGSVLPTYEAGNVGFRVATVPEPSTYALLLLSGAASLWALRRRKN
jgi:sulfatase modifying factor 1